METFLCRRPLIVVVGVSSLLSSEFSRCCCVLHGGDGVPPRVFLRQIWRLVVVVVVGVLLSSLVMCCSWRWRLTFSWMLLSALAPCHRCRCWHLVVVVGVSLPPAASLLSSSESCFPHCVVVVGSVVPSCGYVCRILHLVVCSVSSLLLVGESAHPKLTNLFVHKFESITKPLLVVGNEYQLCSKEDFFDIKDFDAPKDLLEFCGTYVTLHEIKNKLVPLN